MDERDVRLLKAISDLETGSPERLHEETDIPVSTIHYRLNRLREQGIIKNDLYDIDFEELGLDVTVIVEVLADYAESHVEFAERLEAVEGVTQVFFTMGETDFVLLARLSGREMVERLITQLQSMDGVERTNSTFVISTLRDDTRALGSYGIETLLAELTDEE